MRPNIKVSIVIPIYGVEKWIEKCAVSVFEQDYPNIEYVFINDATKDKSLQVLNSTIERYPHLKPKIKIISHKINKGIAKTRETGIKLCTGEFIFQVDSDDWLESHCISTLVNVLNQNPEADIITANCRDVYTAKTIDRESIVNTDIPINISYAMMERRVMWSIWNRLIRKSLYEHIIIPPINNGEDYIMSIQLMYNAHQCVYIPDITYNYNHLNETSFQKRSYDKDTIKDRLKGIMFLKNLYKDDKQAIEALDIGHLDVLAINLGKTLKYRDIKSYEIPLNLLYVLKSKKVKWTRRFLLRLLKMQWYYPIYVTNNIYRLKDIFSF